MQQTINKKIPFLNFLFCLIVPVYHCYTDLIETGPRDSYINSIINRSALNLCIVAMSFFFFVSGYLLFQTWTLRNYPMKLKRRLLSLFVPFVIWNFISVGISMFHDRTWSISDLLKTFLLVKVPPNAPLWYLQAILLLAVLSPLFFLLLKDRRIGWGVVVCVLIGFVVCEYAGVPFYGKLWSIGQLGNVFVYFPSYLAGVYFGIHARELSESDYLKYLLTILAAGICIDCIYPGSFSEIIQHQFPLFLLVFLPLKSWMCDRKIYRASFLIYCIHSPFYETLKKFIDRWIIAVVPHATFQNLVIRFVCLGCVVAISVLLCAVLNRLCPALLSVLTGGRAVKPEAKKG